MEIKVAKNAIFSTISNFDDFQDNLVEFFFFFFKWKISKKALTFFPQEIRDDRHQIRKIQKISFQKVMLVKL